MSTPVTTCLLIAALVTFADETPAAGGVARLARHGAAVRDHLREAGAEKTGAGKVRGRAVGAGPGAGLKRK